MSRSVLLDASPLGILANPGASPLALLCRQWAKALAAQGTRLLISEVADYEVRRELVRAGKTRAIARLDALQTQFTYLPLNTATMREAADLWARTRNMGKPTASNQRLDADAIIAAQAALLIAGGETVIVATSNAKHLAHLVPAADWQSIT